MVSTGLFFAGASISGIPSGFKLLSAVVAYLVREVQVIARMTAPSGNLN